MMPFVGMASRAEWYSPGAPGVTCNSGYDKSLLQNNPLVPRRKEIH